MTRDEDFKVKLKALQFQVLQLSRNLSMSVAQSQESVRKGIKALEDLAQVSQELFKLQCQLSRPDAGEGENPSC